MSQYALLAQRRFGPFFLTQFSGAFNDNLFKQVIVLLLTYQAAKYSSLDPALLINLAAGLFILPYVLFSSIAGQLADKYDKSLIMRVVKLSEVAIMSAATWGLASSNILVMLGCLFLMGAHSTFFGPAKYATLPQVLSKDELVGGNGLLEMGTFLAILGGTIAAGALLLIVPDAWQIGSLCCAVAILGYLACRFIPEMPAAAPGLKVNWNPVTGTWRLLAEAKREKAVWLCLLGISWFWFYGAMLLSQIPTLGKQVLQGSAGVTSILLAAFSIGVAAGSLLCERLSNRRVDIGLVPMGSIGLTVFGLDLFFALSAVTSAVTPVSIWQSWESLRILLDLTLIGAFGGVYIVPLYAFIQARVIENKQARVIAANNILNAVFMVGAAALAAVLLTLGTPVIWLVAVCAGLNAVVALYIYKLLPEFLWRFLAWALVHTVYSLKIKNKKLIPEEGAALICPNHVTYADALLISALSHRPIRFVMDHSIFKNVFLGWLFRAMKAIPIASARADARVLEAAYKAIDDALANGELVCIFPEGKLTRDGEMNEFKAGATKTAQRNDVPMIPVALCGLWGSLLSPYGASVLAKLKARKGRRVLTISVGQPLPSSAMPKDVQEAVRSLRQ